MSFSKGSISAFVLMLFPPKLRDCKFPNPEMYFKSVAGKLFSIYSSRTKDPIVGKFFRLLMDELFSIMHLINVNGSRIFLSSTGISVSL